MPERNHRVIDELIGGDTLSYQHRILQAVLSDNSYLRTLSRLCQIAAEATDWTDVWMGRPTTQTHAIRRVMRFQFRCPYWKVDFETCGLLERSSGTACFVSRSCFVLESFCMWAMYAKLLDSFGVRFDALYHASYIHLLAC
jgi:hypothetical protein